MNEPSHPYDKYIISSQHSELERSAKNHQQD